MLKLTQQLKAAITTYATDLIKSVKSLKAVTHLLFESGYRQENFEATKPNGIEVLTAALDGKPAPKNVPNPVYSEIWNVVEARYTPEQQSLIQLTGQAVRDLSVEQRAERAALRKAIGVTIRNMGTSVKRMTDQHARAVEIAEVKKTVKIPSGMSGKDVEKLYAQAILDHDAANAKPIEQGILVKLAAMQKLITNEATQLLYCTTPATAAAKLAEVAKLLDPDGKISLTS
jgi:hypothetical protein